eukprot:CAMPEP_0195084024 /NCGR_PEP_ID=MMETSP0448-20130528/24799_1 /TAXON_ID=66468 /ORGANISM="Heterocapsa triquestra, Strain CCMP 448" /LENGTH=57 /DNA_ID=CAMNT_0040117289 /DNA_START=203 /DNA_END=373 /DNA_ORIENTATION=-
MSGHLSNAGSQRVRSARTPDACPRLLVPQTNRRHGEPAVTGTSDQSRAADSRRMPAV